MTILVTGAAGFIGFHVAAALLARGEAVLGIDNLNQYYDPGLKRDRLAALEHPAFAFVQADFGDPAALDRATAGVDIDRIVHLGAQAGVRHSIDNPMAYAHSNLTGHLCVLELARARKVGHLVYASSSSVYGADAAAPFTVGAGADKPVSLYAATKRSDELMSEAYAHLYAVPMTGLRYFTVYGPWGRPDMAVWIFTENIFAGRPLRLFNHGAMARDFTYVDDIVAGTLLALDAVPTGHVVHNIGGANPEPLSALVAAIEAATGRAAILEHAPMQPGDVPTTFADIGPLAALGYAPRVGLAEGVARFVAWYRGWRGV